MEQLKISQHLKKHGFKSLKEFSEIVGVVETTLRDWYKKKPRLFHILVLGAVVEKQYTIDL